MPKNNLKLKNILLIRTDRIGDVVLTMPMAVILKRFFPDSRITFLTRAYTAPLFEQFPAVDEVIVYHPENQHKGFKGILSLARSLKKQQYDAAFLFLPQFPLALAVFLAGIPHRFGTGFRWFSLFLNHRKFEHRKYGIKHELEYNLSLLEEVLPNLPASDEIEFGFPGEEHWLSIREPLLKEFGISEPYVIIHPGSGGSAPNLPLEMFKNIVKEIQKKENLEILLVGTPLEKKLLEKIKPDETNRIKCLTDLDLRGYMALISGCQLFISNSTGPLHIARALNRPVLGFYCPSRSCSPVRWGPYNKPEEVLVPELAPCKTGDTRKCPHGNCLAHLGWPEIKAKLEKYFE
ncbi:MAG: glycosyltransferase family 9 protein [Calditrichia bacterium]